MDRFAGTGRQSMRKVNLAKVDFPRPQSGGCLYAVTALLLTSCSFAFMPQALSRSGREGHGNTEAVYEGGNYDDFFKGCGSGANRIEPRCRTFIVLIPESTESTVLQQQSERGARSVGRQDTNRSK